MCRNRILLLKKMTTKHQQGSILQVFLHHYFLLNQMMHDSLLSWLGTFLFLPS